MECVNLKIIERPEIPKRTRNNPMGTVRSLDAAVYVRGRPVLSNSSRRWFATAKEVRFPVSMIAGYLICPAPPEASRRHELGDKTIGQPSFSSA